MKFRFMGLMAAVIVLCGTTMVKAQEKQGYVAPQAPAAAEPKDATPAAAAAFTGSGFGWFSSDGAFDGKGRFFEHLATFYVANATQYFEDANYCYYRENTATNWRWALAKTPYQPNKYAIWLSLTPANMAESWTAKADGIKLNRAGDP
jgi:hypothetical protein